MQNPKITLDRVRGLLRYDPDSGIFTRLVSCKGTAAGTIAGTTRKGARPYVMICIDREFVLAHRLAWFYVNGRWPKHHIDHINGDPSDNRIANLREATASQNLANQRLSAANTSGFKGVKRNRAKWAAKIVVNQKHIHVGNYDTPEEANEAYRAAARRYFGEFAR
jgi:hypothetical protein